MRKTGAKNGHVRRAASMRRTVAAMRRRNEVRDGRRLRNGAKLLPDVVAGVRFIDGEKPDKNAA